jgi:predicted GIY-YIG superfamily endonuclease
MMDAGGQAVTTVYQYFDHAGHILYVGVTARGQRRLREHADTKVWWPLATGCTLEHFTTREAALEREAELIRAYSPPYNTVHNKRKVEARARYDKVATRQRIQVQGRPAPTRSLMRDARTNWYSLSAEKKRVAPCIRCGLRPGLTGPECVACRPRRLLKPN